MDLEDAKENAKKPVTGKKDTIKKILITKPDIILRHFKDNPSQPMSYKDVGEWIEDEVEKGSFKNIKAYEKNMRILVKDGELRRLPSGLFVYE
jgi:RecB family endonuclease NucS